MRWAAIFIVVCLAACATAPGVERSAVVEPVVLRVATWNMEWLDEEDGAGFAARVPSDYALLAAHAARLDADVIAVQEVESEAALARVFDPAVYDFILTERGGAQKTGFVVHAGLDVVRHADYRALNISGNVRDGADVTVVAAGGVALRLLGVHMKSGCFSPTEEARPSAADDCAERLAQTAPLEAWIDARAANGEAFVVLGDFNRRWDDPRDLEWEELDDGVPADADLVRPDEAFAPACDPRYTELIDHIVLDRIAAAWTVAGSFAEWTYGDVRRSDGELPSDHCPLSVELRLAPPGT